MKVYKIETKGSKDDWYESIISPINAESEDRAMDFYVEQGGIADYVRVSEAYPEPIVYEKGYRKII